MSDAAAFRGVSFGGRHNWRVKIHPAFVKVDTATLPKGYSPNTQLKRQPRKPKKALKIIKLDSKWYVKSMHINRYKHTLVQIEPCHVVSTKWHRTLISTCLQDCWFWLDSIIFRCRQQQKNAAQAVPRKNGSLEAPGSVLEKKSGFAANFAEKLAWRPHHVLEPADKSAWFPTHGRFKWDVPWRLEEALLWHSTDVPWRPAQESTARAFQKKKMPHFHQVFELHVVCKSGFLRKGGWQPGTNSQIIVWVSKNLGRCHRSTRTICTQWAKQLESSFWGAKICWWCRCLPSGFKCLQISDSARVNTVCLPLVRPSIYIYIWKSVCVFLQHHKVKQPTLKTKRSCSCLNISTDIFMECGPGHFSTLFPWHPGTSWTGCVAEEGLKGLMKWNSVPMGSWASAIEGRTKTIKILEENHQSIWAIAM